MSRILARTLQFKSVKVRLLVWFLAIGLLPAAVIGWLSYVRARGDLIEATAAKLANMAIEVADKIDRNLFERYGDVQAFAENPNARGTPQQVATAANFYMKCYGIYDLMIVADADGTIVAANTTDAAGKPLDTSRLIGRSVKGEAWFDDIVSGKVPYGQTYYSEAEHGAMTTDVYGEPRVTLNFSAPIVDENGKVARVWSNRVSFQRVVGQIMTAQREEAKEDGIETLETQVLTKTGLVLDDYDPAAVMKLNLAEKGLECALRVQRENRGYVVETHKRRLVDQINGFAKSQGALGFPGYGWGVLVRQDLSEATVAAASLRNFVMVTAGLSAAIIFAIAWWIASSVARPVMTTASVLDAVAQGDLTQRLEIQSRDEFGRMASSLNTAVAASAKTLQDVREAADREQQMQAERAEQERRRAEETRRREEDERQRREAAARAEQERLERERTAKEAAAREQREHELAAEQALRDKVGALLKVVNAAADGDLTAPVTVTGEDAIGELANGLRRMLGDLRHIITQVVESAAQFTEGARVVAEGSQSLAGNAQTQSGVVEQMNHTIERLNASIGGVGENATEADHVAKTTSSLAERGGAAVQQSIEAMDLIKSSSEKISEIISVISEIASQTNLLALNAAIEAARAGEHGLGFAVVADEVRKLAERSNKAAGEVSSLIRESTQRVEQGATLSNETGAALKQIIEGAQATAEKISQIAAATREQAEAASDVGRAIGTVTQGTEQVAAGSEQMASSSEQLGAQATSLRGLVERFKVSREAADDVATRQPSAGERAKPRALAELAV